MKRRLIALAIGAFIASALPNYASAAWLDNVPPRFRIQSKQSTPLAFGAPAAGSVTGSIKGGAGRTRGLRDLQGRDLRSSSRGNAEFPSRLPNQQNLGGTSGGPRF